MNKKNIKKQLKDSIMVALVENTHGKDSKKSKEVIKLAREDEASMNEILRNEFGVDVSHITLNDLTKIADLLGVL